MLEAAIADAASLMAQSKYLVVFTGAGISAESGIPPFRGPDGLWARNNPEFLHIRYFRRKPQQSWKMIKKIFFDLMGKARPNAAHRAIAALEKAGCVKSVITQNIDHLHQAAGSRTVYEYHGTIGALVCMECGMKYPSPTIDLDVLPPRCPGCTGVLKPDFVFFGEAIPDEVDWLARGEAENADVMLIVGTTGTVKPASLIPFIAKRARATIIEINTEDSAFSRNITDIFLRGRATVVLPQLVDIVLAGNVRKK
jgi:NAD-dependent deacetylase